MMPSKRSRRQLPNLRSAQSLHRALAPVLLLLLPALKKHEAKGEEHAYANKNMAYWVSPPQIAYSLGFREENAGATGCRELQNNRSHD
jgi:hypothetical protein